MWRIISGTKLTLFAFLILQPVTGFSQWLQSIRQADVAYFLVSFPPRLERYALSNGQWLAPINLPSTYGLPAVFTVDDTSIYVAFGQNVRRFSLNGSNDTHLINVADSIHGLFIDGGLLLVNHSSGLYARFISLNRSNGTIIDTIENYVDSVYGASIAPSINKVFGRSQGISPADITYIGYNDDGTFSGGGDSPHHGDYPGASKTWVFPGDAKVVDSSGTVYATSSLNYLSSFGGAIDDITFYGNDIPIVKRANRLIAYSNSLLPTGSKDLAFAPQTIYVAGTNVLAFTSDGARPNGIRVDAVPLSDLNPPTPGQPVNPNGLSYTPDHVFVDRDGLLYLFSKTHQSLFRWDTVTQKYLVTVPLVEVPNHVAYSPVTHRAYLAYNSGLIREIDLSSSNRVERPFAVLATTPYGLATAGSYVFAVDGSGAWATHYSFDSTGTLVRSVDWNYISTEYIWSDPNQKMYFFRDDTSPNDLLWEEINANGSAYTNLPPGGIGRYMDSPLHTSEGFMHPIRVAPDGSVVVLGSGVLHDARTLQRLTTSLANTITDAAWLGNELRTVRTISGVSQFQQWTGPNLGLGVVQQFPGQAHRLISAGSNLVGISLVGGKPTFYVMDGSFNIVAPPVIEPPSGLTANIASSTVVNLSWNDVAGEENYVIERKAGVGGTFTEIGTTGMGVTTFADNSVSPGSIFYYRVIARNGSKVSAPSAEASAVLIIPSTPGNFAITAVSSNRITLGWTDVDYESDYVLERRVGAGSAWQPLPALPANTTSYGDLNLTPDTQYSYQLRARNGIGASPYSATVTATTIGVVPTTPTLNSATAPTAFSVQLTWSDALYEAGYVVERRTGSSGTWSRIAAMGSNTVAYADNSVQPVTMYEYRVYATNRFGSSALSNTRTVTTPQKPAPPTPIGLVARTVSSTAISITWGDVPGETGFRLQRRSEDPASWTAIAVLPANIYTFTDTNVAEYTQYFYRVQAFNEVGSSPFSNEDDAMAFDVVCLVEDAFEPDVDTGVWSSIAGGVATNGGAGFGGSVALWFGGAGLRVATTIAMDTSLGGTLEFIIRAGNEVVDGNDFWNNSEQGEDVVLEYSRDGGNEWTAVRFLGGMYPSLSSWTAFSIPIPIGAVGLQTQFRWRQTANSGVGFDTWALDSICVQGAAPPPPQEPPFVISSASSSTTIAVLWIGSSGATRYIVERKQGNSSWTQIADVSGVATYFTDTQCIPGTAHSYRVKAANAGGESGYSPVTTAVTWTQAEDWVYANYGRKDAMSLAEMGRAGPDGTCPLLRFAFNLDAGGPMHYLSPGSSTSGAPAIWLDSATGRLTVEFVRRKASSQPGVIYTVLFGPTISDWTPGGTLVQTESLDAIWERVRYEDSVSAESAASRYCRVGVSLE